MNFQQLATTAFGTKVWLSLGRLPRRTGRAVARGIVSIVHSRKRALIYQVVYANQSVVLGEEATHQEIDAMVGATLQHHGMVAFDVVHAIAHGEQAIIDSIELGEEFWPNIREARATGRGVLICGAHLSAFNLGFLSFALTGDFPILALSAAMPAAGYRVVHDLLSRGALETVPIDPGSLRHAILKMRDGGVALTGSDWPVGSTERIRFFGRPAQLHSGYMRLAMSSNSLVVPLACRWTPERGYYCVTCPPMELELSRDRNADAVHNARRVLGVVEGWIRQAPEQWAMWHRVWPDEED